MAFTFPPKDDRSLTNFSPNSSNYSYFTEEAIRAGYAGPGDGRQAEIQRPSIDVRESAEREIMKQRIRAEIMAEEMARRRILEEEIRMELMLERERALQVEHSRMRFDSYSGPSQLVHEPSGIPQSFGYLEGRRLPLLPVMPVHREAFPGLESSPFQRRLMTPPPEPRKEMVVLARPETSISSLKRKASTPVSYHQGSNNRGFGKKPGEWTCALCNISTTSERALNEHFQGKKHKAMEEGRVDHRIGFGTNPVTKKSSENTRKPKALESTSNPNVKNDRKAYGKSSKPVTGETATFEKKHNNKRKKLDKTDSTSNSKAKAADRAKNFKFWCEMCQVGSVSDIVFSTHMKGKKHLAKLKESETAHGTSADVLPSAIGNQAGRDT